MFLLMLQSDCVGHFPSYFQAWVELDKHASVSHFKVQQRQHEKDVILWYIWDT